MKKNVRNLLYILVFVFITATIFSYNVNKDGYDSKYIEEKVADIDNIPNTFEEKDIKGILCKKTYFQYTSKARTKYYIAVLGSGKLYEIITIASVFDSGNAKDLKKLDKLVGNFVSVKAVITDDSLWDCDIKPIRLKIKYYNNYIKVKE